MTDSPGKFAVGPLTIGGPQFTIIGGPCMAESYEVCMPVATTLQQICADLGFQYIFKASFDKANRTSAGSVRGFGMHEGLELIRRVADEIGAPATTDVHTESQVTTVAAAVDLLQIPAFLCRQSDLLEAAAQSGLPVNVKKGQFLAPHDTKNIVEKLKQFEAKGIMLCERGASFGYNNLIVDMPGLEVMRQFGVPVCFDGTHSAQRPGGQGTSTGGARESIPAMARAATAVGIDALFLEVHPQPEAALSDAATQWPLAQAESLLRQVAAVRQSVAALY